MKTKTAVFPAATTDWFQSSLGQWLVGLERERCQRLVPDGYYPSALQLGLPYYDYLEGIETDIRQQVILPTDFCNGSESRTHQVRALPGALPFSDRTHSLIVLPHVLETTVDPHAVLREVNQILIPEGCLVMTGFNPLSYWRAGKLRWQKHVNAPWQAQSYRVRRVQDWLSLLGFDIIGGSMVAYAPPIQNDRWRGRCGFLEKMGDRWWPALGASWVVVARKREIATSSGSRRLAWNRFIPAIARPAVSAGGLRAESGQARGALKLVVSNKPVAQ